MRVIFLIGNGFDRNIGLDTTYSDFVNVYKHLEAESDHIKNFRSYIKENEELWSKAEEALGKYTQQLEKGQAHIFSECQADFCANLAQYLKKQEERINYEANKENVKKAFKQFRNLTGEFSSEERSKINEVYKRHESGNVIFDFINYNYTYTLDRCLEIVKESPGILGEHNYYAANYKHIVGEVCHVHGTVEGQMVFGVNDESQIGKPTVFEGEDGDLSKSLLIKKDANARYGENTDTKALKILTNSKIIYVYGMALGITDKLWWSRICKKLVDDEGCHLILHQYEMPSSSVIPFKRFSFENTVKKNFVKLGELSEEKRESVKQRIHVTSQNIFAPIQNIALSSPSEIDDLTLKEKDFATVG